MSNFFEDVANIGLIAAIECAGYEAKYRRDTRRFRKECERRIKEIEDREDLNVDTDNYFGFRSFHSFRKASVDQDVPIDEKSVFGIE